MIIQEIAKKFGLEITDQEAELLLKIAKLPTSDINQLFNDIAVEDVFKLRGLRAEGNFYEDALF